MAEVPALPPEKLNEFAQAVELKAGACYAVAFKAVVLLATPLAKFYVLGSAINSRDGKATPHAWVKLWDGTYADPLLQSQGLQAETTYYTFHEMTRQQILDCMREHYGAQKFGEFIAGKLDLYPPETQGPNLYFKEE